jgi:hypothetical protein
MRCHEQFHVRAYQQSPQRDVYPLCAISSFCRLVDSDRSRKGGAILASLQVLWVGRLRAMEAASLQVLWVGQL